ncbi:hypothetical protein MKL11_21505 [Methylobacterium sp. J-077]|nr:hypothetical protein [Methylobacterium sp. J-077]MCJ2125084.1 hypothetical protein [Methylobacterium sp. J-077]
MTGEVRADALAHELRHGLAAMPGGGFDGAGEVSLDLEPKQCVSSERIRHDVATPQSLRSQTMGRLLRCGKPAESTLGFAVLPSCRP